MRLAVYLHYLLGQVHNPDFRNASFAISRNFEVPIVIKAAIGNFDQKEDIRR